MSTIEGRTVAEVREMTDDEHERMSWTPDNSGRPQVLEFDDGTVLFPVRDTEGNSAGAFHGKGVGRDLTNLEGAIIDSLFPMSDAYMEYLGWGDATDIKPTVVNFEDERAIWPARNPEGNKYGYLRAYDDNCGKHETFEFEFESAETDQSED